MCMVYKNGNATHTGIPFPAALQELWPTNALEMASAILEALHLFKSTAARVSLQASPVTVVDLSVCWATLQENSQRNKISLVHILYPFLCLVHLELFHNAPICICNMSFLEQSPGGFISITIQQSGKLDMPVFPLIRVLSDSLLTIIVFIHNNIS